MDKYVYDDGGRALAGYKGSTCDCVTRAIAIATGVPYKEVYDSLNSIAKKGERTGKHKKGISNSRTGVYSNTAKKYLESIGWKWVPTMFVGKGCSVHLDSSELPSGRIIVSVSKHYTAMIDGVIHDTHDPRRWTVETKDGLERTYGRCVYGYFIKR